MSAWSGKAKNESKRVGAEHDGKAVVKWDSSLEPWMYWSLGAIAVIGLLVGWHLVGWIFSRSLAK